jgi:hypothetical protein
LEGNKLMATAVIGVIGLAGSLFGMMQQKKAVSAQKKAANEQLKMQKMEDARRRRELIRLAYLEKEKMYNVSAQIGAGQGATLGTSPVTGASGLQGAVLSGIGYQATLQTSRAKIQNYLNQAASAQSLGSMVTGFTSGIQNMFA